MDVLSQPVLKADHSLPYGEGPEQFGDLWIPQNHGIPQKDGVPQQEGRFPLVVFYHGGWWKSEYDLGYAGYVCDALKKDGIATWSVEYRRIGETGGGWPSTFQDAAAGFDFAATLAKTYPIDLSRVITMGHSAGGHLAFWVAGRHHIDPASAIYQPRPKVPLHGAVALAGAVGLRLTIDHSGSFTFAHDKHEVYALMAGKPVDFPDRYRAGDPGELLPLNVPQILIQGMADDQIPPDLPLRWADQARGSGDTVSVKMIPGADHFDVVDPQSAAWAAVRDSVKKLLFS